MNNLRLIIRGLIFAILFVSFCQDVKADDFTTIDWTELSFENRLPVYSVVYELGDNYADADYEVQLAYPEYEALSRADAKKAQKLGAKNLPDTIVVKSVLSVSRKRGFLDISFTPLIYRNRGIYKLVSYKLVVNRKNNAVQKNASVRKLQRVTTVVANSLPYAENSVLSSGKWVKISVPKEGVYQLTSSYLSSLGFKDPSRVKLYGYGGLMQDSVITYSGDNPNYDDLQEVPLYREASGKLLFYANGVIRWRFVTGKWRHINNPYSSRAYYFLTEGDSPKEMEQVASAVTGNTLRDVVVGHAVYEEDAYSWYSGGQQFFDSYDFAYGNTKTYSLDAPNAVDSTAYVTIVFSASDNSATNVSVSLNSKSLGSLTVPLLNNTQRGETGYKARMTEKTFTASGLNALGNTFRFTTTSGHAARLDYIRVTYPMSLTLSDASLIFSDQEKSGTGNYVIHSANEATRVWRIGTLQRDAQVLTGALSGSDYRVSLPNVKDLYVAVNTNASFPQPTFVSNVENQNLHASQSFDMVILIPESGKLQEQAERLAEFHKSHDNLRVKVVRADQVYNEFSSGTPDAMAYRRYMKMLYDRAATEADMPKYLLLMGDAAWDNRMITQAWKSYDAKDYLLCYESWNSINEIDCYMTDDFFGYLDDGEGKTLTTEKIDLAIGRFPVTTASEAKVMVDKVIQYVGNSNTGAWKNRVCIMGDDDDDNNSLMSDAEEVAARIESKYPAYDIKRVYWDAYERVSSATGNTYPQVTEVLKNLIKQGVLIMNYTGHGSPSLISHEKVLTLSDFQTGKTNYLPLWISASCEIAPFDSQEETIGEEAVLNPNGGAIAFMSSTRSVYSTRNKYLNKYYMDYVLGCDADGNRYSIGEALLRSKIALVTTTTGSDSYMTDRTINKLKYNILGDPALVLTAPREKIVIDSLNGEKVGDENIALKAGSVVRVVGHVENTARQVLNQFDGSVTATIYDRKETVVCKNNANTTISPYTFKSRTKKLFEGTNTVTNGAFSFEFPVSLDASYSEDTGLLSLYAVSNGDSIEAQGAMEKFYINSSSVVTTDSIGPKLYVYLNNPDFQDGGTVNTTPYFVARIEDEDGINVTGSGIGHDLELIIDGDATTSYVLNNYFENDFGTYTTGTVRYSIPELSLGEHRLAFRAWDMQNNSSTAVLNFKVSASASPHLLDVYCSENPATTSTTFTISYDRPETDVTFSLDVYDCMGQHVWTKTVTGQSSTGYYPISWNLTNSKGAPLGGGVYLYKVGVRSVDGGKTSSKTKKLIILNNK